MQNCELVYAQTQKRNNWGQKRQSARPKSDWIRQSAPDLQIVSDQEWAAAHTRIAAARAVYMKATQGQPFGRPKLGNPSKCLLTNLANCSACGAPFLVLSRKHGNGRKHVYGCSAYHERGTCDSRRTVPTTDADLVVIEALLDDVLDESIVRDSIDEALTLLRADDGSAEADRLDTEIAAIDGEHPRLMAAVASGCAAK